MLGMLIYGSIELTMNVVFGVLAMIPLVLACTIYRGESIAAYLQNVMMIGDTAFAKAIGDILTGNPLCHLVAEFVGGIVKVNNIGGINLEFFFPDAAYFTPDVYSIAEQIGNIVFMILWLRVQLDIMAVFFRILPLHTISKSDGLLGAVARPLTNGVYYALSLLGSFFCNALFLTIQNSPYSTIFLAFVLVAEIVLFFGIKAISASYSAIRDTSLLMEIVSGMTTLGCLIMSMQMIYAFLQTNGRPESSFYAVAWLIGVANVKNEWLYQCLAIAVMVILSAATGIF